MRSRLNIASKLARPYEVANSITVSRTAILHNFDLLTKLHDSQVIPVLKSNAYGHGLELVAQILTERTFPYIAVDGYFEALKVRRVSKQPVLVMGSIGTNDINTLRAKDVAFVVFSLESFAAICKTKRGLNIHLEINTGMNRHGLDFTDLDNILQDLHSYPNVHIEGVMTHLASADEVDQSYSKSQFTEFKKALKLLSHHGIKPKYVHATNSAGSAKKIPHGITTIRPGIALYGLNSLKATDPFYSAYANLKPALALTSRIDQIITIKSGESVGYNRTFKAAHDTQIATIPIGYYEGIPRTLSNTSFITYKDKLLPTAGTICMNHTMLDCTNVAAKVGDTVTLISRDSTAPNSIMSLQKTVDVFEYSLTTGLSSAIRRSIAA